MGVWLDPVRVASAHGEATRQARWLRAAYQAYIAVLLLGVVMGPLTLAAVTALREPDVLAVMTSESMPAVAGAVLAALLLLMFCLGQVRGPAMLSPFLIDTVVAGPRPRRATLAPAFLTSSGLVVLTAGVIAAIPVTILAYEGAAAASAVLGFTFAGLLVGCLASVAWLAGQVLERRRHAAVAVGLGVVCVAYLVVEPARMVMPWHWAALQWPGAEAGHVSLALLILSTTAGLMTVPRLLDRITYVSLRDQARTLSTAGSWVLTGDIAGATSFFRAAPAIGRHWSVPATFPRTVRWLLRDAVSLARNPVRLVRGVVSLWLCMLMLVHLETVSSRVQSVLLVIGVLLGYTGATVFGDGYRFVADGAQRPRLLRYTDRYRLILHSMMPLSVLFLLSIILAAAAGVSSGVSLWSVVPAALSAVLIFESVIYAAAKGPMPIALLTPAPTPFGDASPLMILAWQFSGFLVAMTGVAACAYAFLSFGNGPAIVVFAGVLLVNGLLVSRRLTALSSPG